MTQIKSLWMNPKSRRILIGIGSGIVILAAAVMALSTTAYAAVDYNQITSNITSAATNIKNLIKAIFLGVAAVWAIVWFIALAFGSEQTKQRAKTMLFWALVASAGVLLVDEVVEFFTGLFGSK